MSFDPTKHMIKVQGGRDYLGVPARLMWLVSEHPSYSITTLVDAEAKPIKATAHVRIFKDDGTLLREATAIKVGAGTGAANTPMGVETGAIGRALGMLGFGTLAAGDDFEEDLDAMGGISDSPVERKAKPAPAPKAAPQPASVPTGDAIFADDYDHDGVADDKLFSEKQVARTRVIGGKLFSLKGEALEDRLLHAASKILNKNVRTLDILAWQDGKKVMQSLEEEAVKRGVWEAQAK